MVSLLSKRDDRREACSVKDTRDLRDLLQVLQGEERFLKSGGYEKTPARHTDRPTLIFQDSPTCPNYGTTTNRIPCRECVLAELVPSGELKTAFACRHIPLNNEGETVEELYKWRTLAEAKKIVGDWLLHTILKIAQKKYLTQRTGPTIT